LNYRTGAFRHILDNDNRFKKLCERFLS